MKFSIGNIATSVVYASLQPTNRNAPKFKISTGKTYVGTICGLFVFVARHSFMIHIRNPRYDYGKE